MCDWNITGRGSAFSMGVDIVENFIFLKKQQFLSNPAWSINSDSLGFLVVLKNPCLKISNDSMKQD